MPVYGADVEQLDQLGRRLDEEAQKLKHAISTVTTQVAQTWWKGPDADRFRQDWDSTHRAALARLGESLQLAAQQVRRQAAAHREISRG